MRHLILTLAIISATAGAALAQCQSMYMAFTNPNSLEVTVVDSSFGVTPNATVYWDFGDGSRDTTNGWGTTQHTYGAAGGYVICQTVVYNGASCGTYCDSVQVGVGGGTCASAFQFTTSGSTVAFNNYASGSITSYAWDFGDGNTSSLANPTHTYASNGNYTACLTVSDGSGCSDIYCDNVFINVGGNCQAGFVHTGSASGTTIQFYDSSYVGTNTTYSWDFGDGGSATTANPVYTYNGNGAYAVCLTINTYLNGSNCTSTYCDSILVGNTNPNNCDARFTYQTSATGVTQFWGGSPAGGYTYQWTFGDGDSSSLASPVHTYSGPGAYLVCLTITDGNCSDIYCDSILVPSGSTPINISGTVYTGDSINTLLAPADDAMVYLIIEDSVSLYAVDSTITNAGGQYQFTNVTQGNYLIKAALTPNSAEYGNYLPTYHYSSLFWYSASTVQAYQNLSGRDVFMIAGNNQGGPGFVGGLISQGANKQGPGDPVNGVQVMLLNMDDSPVQFTYSDASGAFEFDDVAYGTYQVYTEIPGKATYPVIVTVGPNAETINDINIVVERESVVSGIYQIEEILVSNTRFYPNPVNNVANFEFSLENPGKVSATIVNALGQQVLTLEDNYTAGTQTMQIDLSGQSEGIYVLMLRVNDKPAVYQKLLKQ